MRRGEIIKVDSISLTLRTGDTTTVIPLQLLQTKKVEVFEHPPAPVYRPINFLPFLP